MRRPWRVSACRGARGSSRPAARPSISPVATPRAPTSSPTRSRPAGCGYARPASPSGRWSCKRRRSTLACVATAVDKPQLDREFTELYRSHLQDVYSYAYYRIGNHHDAEDLTEQTFLQAYRHFERAQRESDGRPLRPWLIRIAHNLAANYYRDRSRRPQTQLEDAAVISTPHDTERLVEGREEVQEVLEGVSNLPDDRR